MSVGYNPSEQPVHLVVVVDQKDAVMFPHIGQNFWVSPNVDLRAAVMSPEQHHLFQR